MPLGTISLPVTFRTHGNYRTEYIKFEVEDFNASYHAILGRPAMERFMVVPHYIYLLLKMPGPKGVLSLRGDLKKLFDCDHGAIQCTSTSRAPDTAGEVLAAAQQLSESGMEIPTKKLGQIEPTPEVNTKAIQLQEGDPSMTALIGAYLDDK